MNEIVKVELYGDLVNKFKNNIGMAECSYQLRKIITRYKCTDYNLNVIRPSACLVFNPIAMPPSVIARRLTL